MSDAPAPIACVGPGRMGRGIAHAFAYAGHPVTVVDLKARDAAAAAALADAIRDETATNLAFQVELGLLDDAAAARVLARVGYAGVDDAPAALGAAAAVFECVPEVVATKEPVLAEIGRLAGADALLCSTTSTILVDTLAAFTGVPERFVNTHFLNPAYLLPVVEVSEGAASDPETVDRAVALLESIGKVPVLCAASPGYIIARVQAAAMNEAVRLVEEGVAPAAEIDRAIRTGFGPRYTTMGLLEFLDWGGVDILHYVDRYLNEALDTERFSAPESIGRMIAEGHAGMREGRGFYDFTRMDADAYRKEKQAGFVRLLDHLGLLPRPR